LRADLIGRQYLSNRDWKRSADICSQGFPKTGERFVGKIRGGIRLRGIGHEVKSGLQRTLFDLREGLIAGSSL
jgi:hypothetical protein